MAGRFPLLLDEHVPRPLAHALRECSPLLAVEEDGHAGGLVEEMQLLALQVLGHGQDACPGLSSE
jgi:hypothetical protein